MPSQSRVLTGGRPLPKPTGGPGQLLMSLDPLTAFEPVSVITGSTDGWLVNCDGDLLIEGIK